MKYFETLFLEDARGFIACLDSKASMKLFHNIEVSEQTRDIRFFKKLNHEIWEFRIHCADGHIRLLAFWDKTNRSQTLVVATHGFIKKTMKVPNSEINRAVRLRAEYFENK